jgi:hypothetical protein
VADLGPPHEDRGRPQHRAHGAQPRARRGGDHWHASLLQEGALPNVEAVLRSSVKLEPGVKLRKNWPEHGGLFDGKVVSNAVDVNSTVMPGASAKAWKVKYDVDGPTG